MKIDWRRRHSSRGGGAVLLAVILLSTGCITTSKREILRKPFYDSEYAEYCKLDAKKPPLETEPEHHQKLERNATLKKTVKDMEEELNILDTQTLPDLKADIAYLKGRASGQSGTRDAFLTAISQSMKQIWDFNTAGYRKLQTRNEAGYIPLGIPAFVRKNIWNPEDEANTSYTLIVDSAHPVKQTFFPVQGELHASGTGKFRFVRVRPQDDGAFLVTPLDKEYEISADAPKEGSHHNLRTREKMYPGDYAGIIVENKLGIFYDTTPHLDTFNTGCVLVYPMKNMDLPAAGQTISIQKPDYQKEAAFSFTLFGRYEDEQ